MSSVILLRCRPRPFNPSSTIQQAYKGSTISTRLRTMASTNNPSGLPTRQPTSEERTVIDDVLLLYQLKPSERAYRHYAPDAVFHDPVSIARGLDSVKSQFNGMPKIFESSVTKQCDVLEDGKNPDAIVLNLVQHYVFKGGERTPEKTVTSKITLQRGGSGGLISRHDEEWDHEPNKTGEDGFVGKLQELRKKFDAKVVEASVSSDPSKV